LKKYNDTITIGTISGIIAAIVMTLIDWILLLSGIQFTPPWVVAGNILLNTDVLYTPAGILIGYIVQFLLGSGLGVIVTIVIKLTGKDYYLIKGLGVSSLFYIGSTGIMQTLVNIAPWMRSEISSTLMALINFIVLGVLSSLIIAKYYEFNNKPNFQR
jgi:hypothetical protein